MYELKVEYERESERESYQQLMEKLLYPELRIVGRKETSRWRGWDGMETF